MRKKIVAGNWKMNLSLSEGKMLLEEIRAMQEHSEVNLIVFPPFTHLSSAAAILQGSGISLGAQNCHAMASGAYTGEISAAMIRSCGADYCLVGHSERRTYQKETDAELEQKMRQILSQGMHLIFCCGEQLEDRKKGEHQALVCQQLEVLKNFSIPELENIIIAYEPVWAIGTGETASAAQAQEMHASIRQYLAEAFGKDLAAKTSILYGGSCNPANAPELFSQADVDGGLIGGASLKAADFISISKSF